MEKTEKEINDELLNNMRESLCKMIDRALDRHSKKELIALLGISPYRLRSIMDGTYDGPLSMTVHIAIRLGYTPRLVFNHPIFTET